MKLKNNDALKQICIQSDNIGKYTTIVDDTSELSAQLKQKKYNSFINQIQPYIYKPPSGYSVKLKYSFYSITNYSLKKVLRINVKKHKIYPINKINQTISIYQPIFIYLLSFKTASDWNSSLLYAIWIERESLQNARTRYFWKLPEYHHSSLPLQPTESVLHI